ncbi:hypothetical protein ACFLRF_06300 [Candidatus Altiarchaeota archaeon]
MVQAQVPGGLTFEDFLDRSRRALLEIPPLEFDEFGKIRPTPFTVITDPWDQRGLKGSMYTVLRNAHKAGVKAVVSEGFSGKPAGEFLRYGWETLYGTEGLPRFFSTGDSMVDEPGVVHQESSIEMMGNIRITDLAKGEGVERAAEVVSKRFPSLLDFQREPVLVMSEFMDKGKSFKAMERVLEHLGFTDLHYGALVANEDNVKSEFVHAPYRTKVKPWIGNWVSNRHHIDTPTVPWLHLRSDLYNEYKKPEAEQDKALIEGNRSKMRQTYKELKILAGQIKDLPK